MKDKLFIILLFPISLFPLLILLLSSLALNWNYPDVLPSKLGLYSIVYLWNSKARILEGTFNSLTYSFVTVLITFIVCIIPARTFSLYRGPFKSLLDAVFLLPALIPAVSYAMGLYYILLVTRLTDTLAGIIIALSFVSFPYMFRSLEIGFRYIPPQLGECAANLGGSRVSILLEIYVPLLLPAISAGSSVVFLVAFSNYFLVYLISGNSGFLSGEIFPFLLSSERNVASLLTLIFILIPLILLVGIDRFVLSYYKKRGLTGKEQ